ncbi:hypothetical protein [Nostoc sp.]
MLNVHNEVNKLEVSDRFSLVPIPLLLTLSPLARLHSPSYILHLYVQPQVK